MKEFTITQNDAGQRLDRFLAKAVPLLPASLAQKYIRLKRVKLNGKRAERDTRLTAGDTLQLYINDEFFDTPKEENAYLTVAAPKLHIVYEDENILLVDKKPGQAVHPHDGAEYGRTLISRPISTPSANGGRGRSTPLPPPCATESTAIPAASSSPRKMRRLCASSTRRSRTVRSTSGICASSTARRVRRADGSRGSCSRTRRKTASMSPRPRRRAPRPASRSIRRCRAAAG